MSEVDHVLFAAAIAAGAAGAGAADRPINAVYTVPTRI